MYVYRLDIARMEAIALTARAIAEERLTLARKKKEGLTDQDMCGRSQLLNNSWTKPGPVEFFLFRLMGRWMISMYDLGSWHTPRSGPRLFKSWYWVPIFQAQVIVEGARCRLYLGLSSQFRVDIRTHWPADWDNQICICYIIHFVESTCMYIYTNSNCWGTP